MTSQLHLNSQASQAVHGALNFQRQVNSIIVCGPKLMVIY